MMKYILTLAITGLLMPALHAQRIISYKKVAEDYYAKGDYFSAVKYFEKYLAGKSPVYTRHIAYGMQKQGTHLVNPDKLPAKMVRQIADCYFRVNYFDHATFWYKTLVDHFSSQYPSARYWYAVCLRMKGEYTSAIQEMETFVMQNQINNQYAHVAQHEMDMCTYIRQQLAKPVPGVTTKKLTYNSSPQDSATYTLDSNRMYITASLVNREGKRFLAVLTSEKRDGQWTKFAMMGGNVNVPGFNAAQPFVTPDGKYLLFASDRSGGWGGYDIWYAELGASGEVGAITNMGPTVNTPDDEAAPFFHAASGSLVFASKGRIGMGGFDLFFTEGSFEAGWKEAANMGYPVNSVREETWFVSKGNTLLENALVCSDRMSACCLEIFSINKSE